MFDAYMVVIFHGYMVVVWWLYGCYMAVIAVFMIRLSVVQWYQDQC